MSLAHGRVEARLRKGRAERGAWLKDSEGNMLGMGQAIK